MDARNLNCLQPLPNGLYTDHNNLKDRSFRSVWTQKQNKSLCILGAFIVPLKSIKGFSQPGYFCTASQSEEGKGIWRKKYAVLKEKFLLQLLLRQFVNNRKKPRKNSIHKLILLKKRFFGSESLNIASSILIWKLKEGFGPFTKIFYEIPFR